MVHPVKSSQWRSRLILLLIVSLFFGSFGVAAYLRFSGWEPPQSKNYGELLHPPVDLSALTLLRADGQAYHWSPEKNIWRIVVVPAADCADRCVQILDTLHRLWVSEGRKAERIDILWFGKVPANSVRFRKLIPMQPHSELSSRLPETAGVDAVPVDLVDPSGFLALHYPAGFDPSGLRKDLGKLLK